MLELTNAQSRFLRSKAHHLNPVVFVGKQAVTDTVIDSMDKALAAHELIKVRFVGHKEERHSLCHELAQRTQSSQVGIIGHVGIFYRPHADEEKRQYDLP